MGGVACVFLRKRAQTINSKYDGKELRHISFWVMYHSYSVLLIPHSLPTHSQTGLMIRILCGWGKGVCTTHSWAPSSGFYLGRLEKSLGIPF